MDNASKELADEYRRLGGRRVAVIDDNLGSSSDWDGDPPAWQTDTLSVMHQCDQFLEIFINIHATPQYSYLKWLYALRARSALYRNQSNYITRTIAHDYGHNSPTPRISGSSGFSPSAYRYGDPECKFREPGASAVRVDLDRHHA